MTDQPHYPHSDGERAVLGPEVFASADGETISWQGATYRREGAAGGHEQLREQIAAAIAEKVDGTPGCANRYRLADVVLAVVRPELDQEREHYGRLALRLDKAIGRAEQAEAALATIRALADEHPVSVDTALIHAALDQPPAHNAGPSVREAAAQDRRWWGSEKAGE